MPLAWATFAIALTCGAAPPIVVLIPPESATASVAAAHLRDEVGSIEAHSVDVARAREAWPSSLVIVLDPERNEASLMRPNDDAVLVRRLPARSRGSALALAVAAAELVRIAAAEKPAVIAPAPPPPPPSEARELLFSLGVGAASSPAVLQPIFGADVQLGGSGWWSAIGLRARGPSFASSSAANGVVIEYRRIDLSARIAFGPELDRLRVLGVLEGGASFANARALRSAQVLGEVDRVPFWMAVGIEAQYSVWQALRVSLGVELARSISPADYAGNGDIVLAEGDLRLQVGLGVHWAIR